MSWYNPFFPLHYQKVGVTKSFVVKLVTFNQQGCIKLMKFYSKYIYNDTRDLYFK